MSMEAHTGETGRPTSTIEYDDDVLAAMWAQVGFGRGLSQIQMHHVFQMGRNLQWSIDNTEALTGDDAALRDAAPELLDALRVAVSAFDRFVADNNRYALSVHLDAHSRAGRLVEHFGGLGTHEEVPR